MALRKLGLITTLKPLLGYPPLLALVSCLIACGAEQNDPSAQISNDSAAFESMPTPKPVAGPAIEQHHYYFDVNDHSEDEVLELLKRAQDVYDSLPVDQRQSLKIAMVLHGPDLQYFAKRNYKKHKALVDTAARLEAFGFIDLKVCAESARSHGVEDDGFPPFVDIVPFGPGEIRELERQGYTKL